MVAGTLLAGPGCAGAGFAAAAYATTGPSTIGAQQAAVVAANFRQPLDLARFAVANYTVAAARDQQSVTTDQAVEVAAEARAGTAAARLAGDRETLAAATATLSSAERLLSGDRVRLRALAIGMYTGALTNPQPANALQLAGEQARIIDAAEAGVVAIVVDGHLHSDLGAVAADRISESAADRRVADDTMIRSRQSAAAAAAVARTAADQSRLARDQAQLADAAQHLDATEAGLAAALASLSGPVPAPPGQLTLLGGSALSAPQLVGWYNAQGYVDLTAAPIGQLAAWYIASGATEGVRGDLAFAQAVLETGGFSSPDAVDLSNFAGIGHCDSCASGWAFPSPQAGVLGQIQLLRIFADRGTGPAGAPPPVLAILTPTKETSAGCCSTVEALTGVWATDPGYAGQILSIYGSMLAYALASAPAS